MAADTGTVGLYISRLTIALQLVGQAVPTNHESKATSFNAIQHFVDDVALEKFQAIAPEQFDSLTKMAIKSWASAT